MVESSRKSSGITTPAIKISVARIILYCIGFLFRTNREIYIYFHFLYQLLNIVLCVHLHTHTHIHKHQTSNTHTQKSLIGISILTRKYLKKYYQLKNVH